MPELPEVETTLNGILPYINKQKIISVVVRNRSLRWPIPKKIEQILQNQTITSATRRGKYLLLHTQEGTILIHLGMSGSLRILTQWVKAKKHDHIDIEFANQTTLRFTDPRRFGAFLWTNQPPEQHTLLKNLGPEPLSNPFTGKYLWKKAQGRKVPIKSFVMDSKIVVGVGNIYATEALFDAGVRPDAPAGQIPLAQCKTIATAIKKVLRFAIKKGGTTLKDFSHSDGKPGYFKQHLNVYGRGALPCVNCNTTLIEYRLGQRSTVYCPICQP